MCCAVAIAQDPGVTSNAPTSPSTQAGEGDVAVVLVVDNSVSAGDQYSAVVNSVKAFVSRFAGADQEMALITAGGHPQIQQGFTADTNLLLSRLDGARPQGRLLLYDSIRAAAQHARNDGPTNHAVIVAFVAGTDPASDEAARAALADQPAGWRNELHVISSPGADWRNQEKLQRLTAPTGGTAYFPSSTAQMLDVASILGKRLSTGNENLSADVRLNNRGRPLVGYRRLVVQGMTVSPGKETEDLAGEEQLLERMLVSRLKRSGMFEEVVDATTQQQAAVLPHSDVSGNNSAPPAIPTREVDTLLLMPRLVEFRKGSRVQRQFVGWKGEARYKVQVSVIDPATQRTVLAFVKRGASGSGVFGGSQEQVHAKAMMTVVNGVVNELKRAK